MEREGLKQLTDQLRDTPSDAVAQLSEDDLLHLSDLIAQARQRQTEQLAAASEKALQHVPRLLRGTVKKIVS